MSNTSQRGCEIAWNTSQNLFKLFLCDIGLLASQMSSTVRLEFLQGGELSANWGSILENAVAQELTVHGIKLRYFDKAKYGEVDFLLSTPQGVLPVKTQPGNGYESHRALSNIMDVREWEVDRAIVLCKENVRLSKRIAYLPWYAVMLLHEER